MFSFQKCWQHKKVVDLIASSCLREDEVIFFHIEEKLAREMQLFTYKCMMTLAHLKCTSCLSEWMPILINLAL